MSAGRENVELPISASSIATLESLAEETRAELDMLTSKSQDLFQQADTNFTDMRKEGYRLHAAFFHRGTQGSGHYWVYIYDFKKEIWRKYNDGYVNEVRDTNEIFRAPTEAELNTWSGPPNPYFLVYVREDIKDQLVEAVHRQIIRPSPPPAPPLPPPPPKANVPEGDVEMGDEGENAGTNHTVEI